MEQKNKRAAIYARVGGWDEDALENIKCRLEFETLIAEREGFEVVKTYGDHCLKRDGIAGIGGFNQLMEDARKGEFDIIVASSISRFGRNIIQAVGYIKKLKELGIEVYFEKENIYTFSPKGEYVIDILFKMAKEEEKSIKEATAKWAKLQ